MTQDNCANSGLTFWSDRSVDVDGFDVDIIAVQGLGAHPFYTWVKKTTDVQETDKTRSRWLGGKKSLKKSSKKTNDGESVSQQVMWPRDLLVPEFSRARVATYSYESDWRNRHVNTSLRECGQQLLEVLIQHRQCANERQRPLILIGHSLGGLVVQQALVIAVHGSMYIDLRTSIAGIIFLGTPFQGSDAAEYGKKLAKLIRLPNEDKYTLLETLQKDNQELYNLSIDFWRSYNTHDMTCFYENKEAQYGPVKSQFVERQSATIVGKKMMFMNADHSGLNKFHGKDDPNFGLLLLELRRMVEMGPSIIKGRLASQTAEVAGNKHWIVPRPVNSLFTGRDELVSRIQAALRDGNTRNTKRKQIVLMGLGGIGKSELCLQIVNTMREEFWAIFWVDVVSLFTAKNGFAIIAKILGAPTETIEDALLALANTKKNWLLILDNADDCEFDYQRYLPSGIMGTVIMTSRNSECSRYSTVLAEEIGPLDEEHSKQLLFKAAQVPEQQWQFYDEPAQGIARLLGSHTLALIQAGAYISKGYCQLAEYPERYHKQRKRLLEHYPKQEQSRYRHVYATFEASVDVINSEQDGRDALDLLGVLAMFHYSQFPELVFQDACNKAIKLRNVEPPIVQDESDLGLWHISQLPSFMDGQTDEWDDFPLKKAYNLLDSLALVTKVSTNGLVGLTMHPLVHAWAKDRLQVHIQQQIWLSAGCVLALLQQSGMWYTYRREMKPHIISLLICDVDIVSDVDTEPDVDIVLNVDTVIHFGTQTQILPVLYWYGVALDTIREDVKLEAFLRSIYKYLQISPGEPSEPYIKIWYMAYRNAARMGRHKQAVLLLAHILDFLKAMRPDTHPYTIELQQELAEAYFDNGQREDAIKLAEHAAKMTDSLTEADPSRLKSQHMLASTYIRSGRTIEAIEVLERVAKAQDSLPDSQPDRLNTLRMLSMAYFCDCQPKAAIRVLEHGIKITENALVTADPQRLSSQHALADIYLKAGQIKEAVKLQEHVVRIRRQVLVEADPVLQDSLHLLTDAYLRNGQIKEAIELQERISKYQESLPETHPTRLRSQNKLAVAYFKNDQINEALRLLEHVVMVQQSTLVETHPSLLDSQIDLVRAFFRNKQIDKALTLLEHNIQMRKKVFGASHPDLLFSLHILADIYRYNGQILESISLWEHIVAAECQVGQTGQLCRSKSQFALGKAYLANSQIDEATALIEHVVRVRESFLSKSHPNLLGPQRKLARAYYANGEYEKAIALMDHVAAMKSQANEEDGSSTVRSMEAPQPTCTASAEERRYMTGSTSVFKPGLQNE